VFLRDDGPTIPGVARYDDPAHVVHEANDGCVKMREDQLATTRDDDDRTAANLQPGDTWVDEYGVAVEVVSMDDVPHPDGGERWHLTLVRHQDGGRYDAVLHHPTGYPPAPKEGHE